MNLTGFIYVLAVAGVLVVTGFMLAANIGLNFRTGQRLRAEYAQRVSGLRLGRMLEQRKIDVESYLHEAMVHAIERHVRVCAGCAKTNECDAALAAAGKVDLSFCPNNTDLARLRPQTENVIPILSRKPVMPAPSWERVTR